MVTRNMTHLVLVFFMAFGSICIGSAIEAEAQSEGQAGSAMGGDSAASSGLQDQVPPRPQGQDDDQNDVGQSDDAADMVAPAEGDGDEAELPEGQAVEVGSFGEIDLHVKDLSLGKVLQLLSMQSKRNIVASRNVSGNISADLYDVGFYEALDAILHTNGFGYIEKGNFVYVYTQEELRAIEEQNRKAVTKVVRLDYLTANDASAFVSPMLSGSGTISVSGDTEDGFQPTMQDAGGDSFAHAATLVIRDYTENVEQIMQVLEDLDQRPRQVLIESTILQARLTEANAYGVDFALFADLDVDNFTQPLGSVDDLISGTGRDDDVLTNGGGVGATPGQVGEGDATIKLGFLGNDAAVFIRALDTVTDTTVLATPKVLVLNRQRAELHVGEELGYLSSTATDTSTTQTVEFLEIGTQLAVRPFVSDDGFVRMELQPSISEGDTELVGGFVIPDTSTQKLTTNVMVESGQTVVLGGLFKEDTSVGRRQVPLLGDLPVVGPAFRGQDDNIIRSEVIFLIKPTVMKDKSLYAQGEDAVRDVGLARVGSRQNLLPWSQTKLTHSHLKKAYEYKRQGDTEMALWHTDLALHANPTMIEALRLKEDLSGEKMMVRDRSILESAVDGVIESHADDDADDTAEDEAQDSDWMNDEIDDMPADDAQNDAQDDAQDDMQEFESESNLENESELESEDAASQMTEEAAHTPAVSAEAASSNPSAAQNDSDASDASESSEPMDPMLESAVDDVIESEMDDSDDAATEADAESASDAEADAQASAADESSDDEDTADADADADAADESDDDSDATVQSASDTVGK